MSIVHLLVQVYQMALLKTKILVTCFCVCFSDYDQVVQTHNETYPKRENVIGKLFKIVLNLSILSSYTHTTLWEG